jgi:hypothetical protein
MSGGVESSTVSRSGRCVQCQFECAERGERKNAATVQAALHVDCRLIRTIRASWRTALHAFLRRIGVVDYASRLPPLVSG